MHTAASKSRRLVRGAACVAITPSVAVGRLSVAVRAVHIGARLGPRRRQGLDAVDRRRVEQVIGPGARGEGHGRARGIARVVARKIVVTI